jgi:hypothetical protein
VRENQHKDLIWRSPGGCTGGNACVEVAALPDGGAAMRDGEDPDGPVLRFGARQWAEFLAAARAGEFDPSAEG